MRRLNSENLAHKVRVEQLERDLENMRGIVNGLKKQKNKTNESQDQDDFVCRSKGEGSEKQVQSKKTPKSPRKEKEPSVVAISYASVH